MWRFAGICVQFKLNYHIIRFIFQHFKKKKFYLPAWNFVKTEFEGH